MASKLKVDTLENSSSSVSLPVIDLIDQTRYNSMGQSSFRNRIVDGRFDFWYEGTSQNTFTEHNYGSDTMWCNWAGTDTTGTDTTGAARTHSKVALVVGEIPDVPSAMAFSRTVITATGNASNCAIGKSQHIESVYTLAGKKVTLSFYAKADTTRDIMVEFEQYFGATGSSIVKGIGAKKITLTSSWARYTMTTTIPSIAGKTVSGGNDFLDVVFIFSGNSTFESFINITKQTGTFDIACVQVEEGSFATPFEELPYAISEEQVNRYYQYVLIGVDSPIGYCPLNNATSQAFMRQVPMRTYPVITITPQTGCQVKEVGGGILATSVSVEILHNTHFYFDINAKFTSYAYSAGNFLHINLYVISDSRL